MVNEDDIASEYFSFAVNILNLHVFIIIIIIIIIIQSNSKMTKARKFAWLEWRDHSSKFLWISPGNNVVQSDRKTSVANFSSMKESFIRPLASFQYAF